MRSSPNIVRRSPNMMQPPATQRESTQASFLLGILSDIDIDVGWV